MRRLSLLFVMALALPASAGDATWGKSAFQTSCSRCHEATRATGNTAPKDLALWMATTPGAGEKMRTWVKNPFLVRPTTLCQARELRPQEVSDLITYLRGIPKP